MSLPKPVWPFVPDDDYEAIAARFRPIFDEIREGAIARDRDRTLPIKELELLREARFGALRVPQSQGGFGASLTTLFALLIELAEADSNLVQILRGHVGFIETLLQRKDPAWSDRWLKRAAAGDWFSPAHTEPGASHHGTFKTVVSKTAAGFELDGRKYYTTGAYYADWIGVTADHGEEPVVVVVPTKARGVSVIDDWDGFGQSLTASGTTIFDHVAVGADDFRPALAQAEHLTSVYQLTHLSTLAGIGRAAATETAAYIAARQRTYAHGVGAAARDDPQILQVVGSVFSKVYGANVAAIAAAASTERFFQKLLAQTATVDDLSRLEVEVYQAQVATATQVLDATASLFAGLGASALSRSRGLDRLWRNARAISSHNPLIYRDRQIGDFAVNGTPPPSPLAAARSKRANESLSHEKAA